MTTMENLQRRRQGTILLGTKGFQNRLQRTAGSAIGTVQSDRDFLEFKGARK
jgi:hypothetical protein